MRRAENGLIREPVRRSGVHAHQMIVPLHRGVAQDLQVPGDVCQPGDLCGWTASLQRRSSV